MWQRMYYKLWGRGFRGCFNPSKLNNMASKTNGSTSTSRYAPKLFLLFSFLNKLLICPLLTMHLLLHWMGMIVKLLFVSIPSWMVVIKWTEAEWRRLYEEWVHLWLQRLTTMADARLQRLPPQGSQATIRLYSMVPHINLPYSYRNRYIY